MTSPSESTVTEQAVEACAAALRQWAQSDTRKRDDEVDTARVALAAAVPVLFAALADEIEADTDRARSAGFKQFDAGANYAASLVRSAAGRWGSDAK